MTSDADPVTDPMPAPDEAAALIRARSTINRFRPDAPSRALIETALELGRWAPNHHLTQPWRFYLIGEATKARIIDINRDIMTQRQGAEAGEAKAESWGRIPGWLAVTRVRAPSERQAWEDYAACACAIQNMALYLWSCSVGTKWTTGPVTEDARFYEALGIDAEVETVVGLIWYGYPDEQPRRQRKPLTECLVALP